VANKLGEFEQITLLALIRLKENAYGMTIRQQISERTGREASIGAIYTTLDRLEKKGFVNSKLGDPTPERGGRVKRFYQINTKGLDVLVRSKHTMDAMWKGLQVA